MENKPAPVIALSGGTLLKRGKPPEAEIQHKNIGPATKVIAQLTQHWRIILIHGNGPQAGLLALQNSAYTYAVPYPFDILGAENQGMISYMLQQVLKNQLPQREISALLTQVEVDANNPTFNNPTKYISSIYNHAQIQVLRTGKGRVFEADGHFLHRTVSSPQPRRIVGRDTVQTLIIHDHPVICSGGDGIPVVEKADGYYRIETVTNKSPSVTPLASQIHADILLTLTDADAVCLGWGKPTQRPPAQVTLGLFNEMQFDTGSMRPKVTAYVEFASQCRGIAGIGFLADGPEVLTGDKGTLIRLDTLHSHA